MARRITKGFFFHIPFSTTDPLTHTFTSGLRRLLIAGSPSMELAACLTNPGATPYVPSHKIQKQTLNDFNDILLSIVCEFST